MSTSASSVAVLSEEVEPECTHRLYRKIDGRFQEVVFDPSLVILTRFSLSDTWHRGTPKGHPWGSVMMVCDGQESSPAGDGEGPVEAFDLAIRRAFQDLGHSVESVKMVKYDPKDVNAKQEGARAEMKVRTYFQLENEEWRVDTFSRDVVMASVFGLWIGYSYGLTASA